MVFTVPDQSRSTRAVNGCHLRGCSKKSARQCPDYRETTRMSSIRVRTRRDGTDYTQVMFRHNGKQQSMSFDDHAAGLRWRKALDELGAERALERLQIAENVEANPVVTIASAGADHIDNLTGVTDGTRKRYRAYMRNDIEPFFGPSTAADMIPDKRIRQWVKACA
ncbi:hypothetical protein ACQPXH_02150 [Nocardia sp. CA-135953]|uniref:hypothetical protein n=1 Tax=Nocardia sp. CA-135953 TaxID=3239978 RepID=UPI003D99A348